MCNITLNLLVMVFLKLTRYIPSQMLALIQASITKCLSLSSPSFSTSYIVFLGHPNVFLGGYLSISFSFPTTPVSFPPCVGPSLISNSFYFLCGLRRTKQYMLTSLFLFMEWKLRSRLGYERVSS